jgi:signal transduction histidine kinase
MLVSTGQALPTTHWGRASAVPRGAVAADEPVATRFARLMGAASRSLRTQLLAQLGTLVSTAVLVTGLIAWLFARYGDDAAFGRTLVALWLGSTALFLLVGGYLVHRLILRPLAQLASEADALATGEVRLATRYETDDFRHLAVRYRDMAETLMATHSQMVRVEKLAGIGQLAAGVAHEVRNPLGALHTYVEVLERRAARDAAADGEVVAAMRHEIGRIELTVQSLLDYARPGALTGTADVNAAATAVLGFLDAQGALRGLQVRQDLAPVLPRVHADQHTMEQLLVNLLLNARDAAPGGRITIGTRPELYEPSLRARVRAAEGGAVPARRWTLRPHRRDLAPRTPGVLLFVADSGPGVPEALRERIFDPFFTTKEPGQGSGLGLAIVAQAVHAAGGLVWVDPAREGGAVFKAFLPAAEAA